MSVPAPDAWVNIGDTQIVVVSDGVIWMDGGAIFGLTPRVLWERVIKPDPLNRLPLALNCLIIRSEGKTILVDTGLGTKVTAKEINNFSYSNDGGLVVDLLRHGIKPTDIDIVINTHLHSDHCGGNTFCQDDRAVPTFPNAEYWIQKAEWDMAVQPNERTKATYFSDNYLPLQEFGVLRLIEGETAVTSTARCLPTPGHTPGHQSVVINSKGESAIYFGDVGQYPVHFERLAWIAAFDVEPLVTLETKRSLVERMTREKALVILGHAAFPGLGHLVEDNNKILWQPL